MVEPQTPDWVRDAIFYQIFPDRFARSLTVPKPRHLDEWGAPPTYHGYQGGDLIGVVEHLDYLVDLGINAIYFTPIFQSASNHRYHTHDYEKVDPMLGGNAALAQADRRGPCPGHPRRARRRLQPRQPRLLPVPRHPGERPELGLPRLVHRQAGSRSTPTTRTSRPTTRPGGACPPCPSSTPTAPRSASSSGGSAASGSTSASTAGGSTSPTRSTTTTSGASSAAASRAVNPEAYIVGEVWTDAPRWLQGDMWDAVMNYQFTRACIAFFIGEDVDRRRAAQDQPLPARAAGRPRRSAGTSSG